MKVLLIEPFYTGSHKLWADGLKNHSAFSFDIWSMSGHHWKWRMHGSAVSFAQRAQSQTPPDVIVTTDMMDVAVFRGLLPIQWKEIPVLLYFHENQISYPWSATDPDPGKGRDKHYGFINYTSALAADLVCFNSEYHRSNFLSCLPNFLKDFPDEIPSGTVAEIEDKSRVIYPGIECADIRKLNEKRIQNRIVWNHRWEYDKNPEDFFSLLSKLKQDGIDFELVVTGESFPKSPPIFKKAHREFENEIVHWGYCESREEYLRWLVSSGIAVVTSNQDFFGISAVETIAAGCHTLLPNRLAFPEHAESGELLYQNLDEAYVMLQAAFSNPSGMTRHAAQSASERYDWKNLIDHYDMAIQSLMK